MYATNTELVPLFKLKRTLTSSVLDSLDYAKKTACSIHLNLVDMSCLIDGLLKQKIGVAGYVLNTFNVQAFVKEFEYSGTEKDTVYDTWIARVFQRADEVADYMDDSVIDTEHVLLGLCGVFWHDLRYHQIRNISILEIKEEVLRYLGYIIDKYNKWDAENEKKRLQKEQEMNTHEDEEKDDSCRKGESTCCTDEQEALIKEQQDVLNEQMDLIQEQEIELKDLRKKLEACRVLVLFALNNSSCDEILEAAVSEMSDYLR